ncbi:MAG: hypothetical protein HYT61_01635 [Candidatus Yanofskybacteria bacterium]|nr:hypothetical protein [Candidatus Yanofskybacteria bacterium]
MNGFKLVLILFLCPLSVLAQEKFKGVEFPYDWHKGDQDFFVKKNSISTADGLLSYEAYYFEKDPFFRFVWISESKNGSVITVLQWIEDQEKGHLFRLVKKRKFLILLKQRWTEEPMMQDSDYRRLFPLISPDLANQKTGEAVMLNEMSRSLNETPTLILVLGCIIVLWIILKKHTKTSS